MAVSFEKQRRRLRETEGKRLRESGKEEGFCGRKIEFPTRKILEEDMFFVSGKISPESEVLGKGFGRRMSG